MSAPEHMPAVLTRVNLENERIRADAAERRAATAALRADAGEVAVRAARADVEECLAAMLAAHRSLTIAPLAPVLRRHGRI